MIFTAIVLVFAGAATTFGLCMMRPRNPVAAGRVRSDVITQLVRHTHFAIRSQGWQRFPEGAVIVNRASWTGADLLDALDRLLEVIDAHYKERSRPRRVPSNVAHYDGGLQIIRDALRELARYEQP